VGDSSPFDEISCILPSKFQPRQVRLFVARWNAGFKLSDMMTMISRPLAFAASNSSPKCRLSAWPTNGQISRHPGTHPNHHIHIKRDPAEKAAAPLAQGLQSIIDSVISYQRRRSPQAGRMPRRKSQSSTEGSETGASGNGDGEEVEVEMLGEPFKGP
jgi:hypothetical protein